MIETKIELYGKFNSLPIESHFVQGKVKPKRALNVLSLSKRRATLIAYYGNVKTYRLTGGLIMTLTEG